MYRIGFGLETIINFVPIVPKPHNIPQIFLVLISNNVIYA